ncbi:Crp/Fnr family transcriptional regulator [Pseudoduganella sp. OTU4001]|uniref:Crp/Fnr family transcriptional regulator n=1 Tax=Pseudoduganella sp. OTU4001 TaxID=3043854 RepID=UPI00313C7D43
MYDDFLTFRDRHAQLRMRRHQISREDYDQITRLLQPIVRPVRARKDEFLQKVGEPATTIFWIAEGVARNGLATPDGDMVTVRFASEGDSANAHEDILALGGELARIYFIAAETALLAYAFDWDDLVRVRAAHPEMERHYQRTLHHIVQDYSVQEQARVASLSAEEKLAQFRAEYPGLESRVRQKTLAAYIGVTPAYFSQLLRREAKIT